MIWPMFPMEQMLPFAAVVCAGIFVQSATGFAGGLVIIPLMLWAGHGVPEAQTAMLTATIPQNLLGIFQFRDTINTREMALPALLRFAAMPVGVATLVYVEGLPVDAVRQLVGGVVIGCVLLLMYVSPKPRSHVPIQWTLLAFLSSGYFVGLTGTGGPMMVLWVQAHEWSTRRSRSFLFVMYLLSIPPILFMLWLTFGDRVTRAFCSAVTLIPLLLLVTRIGLQVGTRLGRERLRRVTMWLLLLIGFLGLISPLLR